MPAILEIRMQSNEVTCALCGCDTEYRWGVPTYNGDIVSNDFPDEMWEHGGGVAVCEVCHARHEAGLVPVADDDYARQVYLLRLKQVGFIGGTGI